MAARSSLSRGGFHLMLGFLIFAVTISNVCVEGRNKGRKPGGHNKVHESKHKEIACDIEKILHDCGMMGKVKEIRYVTEQIVQGKMLRVIFMYEDEGSGEEKGLSTCYFKLWTKPKDAGNPEVRLSCTKPAGYERGNMEVD